MIFSFNVTFCPDVVGETDSRSNMFNQQLRFVVADLKVVTIGQCLLIFPTRIPSGELFGNNLRVHAQTDIIKLRLKLNNQCLFMMIGLT